MKPISIYVHIPFCKSKCYYCDFISYAQKDDIYIEYTKCIIKEIEREHSKYRDCEVHTVFIGGGTPTVIPYEYIIEILDTIKFYYNMHNSVEITIEANPGTVNYQKLLNLNKSGIDRISLGLQSWQNRLLKNLGRIYLQKDFIESFELSREAGFKNINIDLMFAIPDQTVEDWKETLYNTVKLKPEHISTYSLIVEDGTVFGDMYSKGILNLVDDCTDRNMYYTAKDFLKQNGYIHYEISNFAQSEFECLHNITYWTQKEYIGFGLAAHSYFNGMRFHNTCNMDKYLNDFDIIEDIYKNDILDDYAEFMFLGLRMLKGVSKNEFKFKFGVDIYDIYSKELDECKKIKVIKEMDDFISLTPRGIDISNIVFEKFLIK